MSVSSCKSRLIARLKRVGAVGLVDVCHFEDVNGKSKQPVALFSTEHWEQILDAVDHQRGESRPTRDRQTERLWQHAYEAWVNDSPETADEMFTRCVLRQPDLADGYLALYGIRGGSEDLHLALAVSAERVREYQQQLDSKLYVYYTPLYFNSVPLGSPDDARLAYAAFLAAGDNTASTAGSLVWAARCRATDTRTLAVLGRIAIAEQRWQDAVAYLQQVAKLDEELRSDAHLGLGFAFERLGLGAAARTAFTTAADSAETSQAQRYCRYRLALVHLRLGNRKQGSRLLEQIYAENASFLDVAQLLGIGIDHPAEGGDGDVARISQDEDEFDAIVRMLEDGRLNNDPGILDNRPLNH